MDKNAQTYYLTIKRNSQWERSIQSTDVEYLDNLGQQWLKLNTIEDYSVGFNPIGGQPVAHKGAFGLDVVA